jgi:hypothetical protein
MLAKDKSRGQTFQEKGQQQQTMWQWGMESMGSCNLSALTRTKMMMLIWDG